VTEKQWGKLRATWNFGSEKEAVRTAHVFIEQWNETGSAVGKSVGPKKK
jgi:hypothetical protein